MSSDRYKEALALARVEHIQNSLGLMKEQMRKAYRGRAWEALDYPSWTTYVIKEFIAADHFAEMPEEVQATCAKTVLSIAQEIHDEEVAAKS
jgi:hypothetical protein